MVVTATTRNQIIFLGQSGQVPDCVIVVLGVIYFHPNQTDFLEVGYPCFHIIHKRRMGQHGDTANFLNHFYPCGRG